MKSTRDSFDKGAPTFLAATRSCISMVALDISLAAALALGSTTTAAAEGSPTGTGQTTCYQLERYPAGHPLGPDPVTGEPGQVVVRDASGTTEFDPSGQPSLLFDPSTGKVSDHVVPCTGTGQDGEKQMGLRLRYTDRGDGRITDRNTGLTWAKKSDDGGLHDKDNIYTWDEAFKYIHTMNNTCQLSQNATPPAVPTPCLSNLDCPAVGDRCGFAGKRDWRLPNIKELGTLVNFGVFSTEQSPSPTVHPVFNTNCVPGVTVLTGSCTHADSITNDGHGDFVPFGTPGSIRVPFTYWTSTTGDALGDAWFVDFFTGDNGAHFKDTDIDVDTTVDPPVITHAGHVRAVRGGESELDQDDDRRD